MREWFTQNRVIEISIERLPEILMLCVMMGLSIALGTALYKSVEANFPETMPLGPGMGDGDPAIFWSAPDTVGVVYYANISKDTTSVSKDAHHASELPGLRIPWLDFLARYSPEDWVVCDQSHQSEEAMKPGGCSKTIRLRDLDWFQKETQHLLWGSGEAMDIDTWGKAECQTWTYYQLYKNASATKNGKAPSGCRIAAYMARSIVYGRFKCFNGGAIWVLGDLLLYFTCLMMTIAYFSPCLPRASILRWALYCKVFQLVLRFMRHHSVIADPATSSVPEVFLADGGHLDNTGIIALLKRQCKCILAVDAERGRSCASIYKIVENAKEFVQCGFSLPEHEQKFTGSFEEMMLDFRLPRARYVGHDGSSAQKAGELELVKRFKQVRRLMSGWELSDQGTMQRVQEDASLLKRLMSHCRKRDGHVYLYFKDDRSVCSAYHRFEFIRKNFKLCQAVDDPKEKLKPEYYLDGDVIRSETVRNVVHLKVHYSNRMVGDVYILRGELGPKDIEMTREKLKKWETPFATKGKFPAHSTGIGEGHSWEHMDEYAKYAIQSAEQAWSGIPDPLEDSLLRPWSEEIKLWRAGARNTEINPDNWTG